MITGAQIREARKLLGLQPYQLARLVTMHLSVIRRAESVDGEPPITVYQEAFIRHALEAAGVEFTNGNAPGVTLRVRTPGQKEERPKAL
jgi:hypothetical protein